LEAYSAESFPSYLGMLCQELANEVTPLHIRQAAGLMLKNALSARQSGRKEELANRWLQGVDANTKMQLKASVLATLGSQSANAGTVAAQVCGGSVLALRWCIARRDLTTPTPTDCRRHCRD
jgi:importin subunit beta-1